MTQPHSFLENTCMAKWGRRRFTEKIGMNEDKKVFSEFTLQMLFYCYNPAEVKQNPFKNV